MAEKNVYQVADWNGQSGERWVAYQARLDAMMAVFGQAAIEAAAPATGERVLDVERMDGCPVVALGSDAARQGADVKASFEAGIREYLMMLAPWVGETNGEDASGKAMTILSMMVGAMVLSRAVNDEDLSKQFLQTAAERVSMDSSTDEARQEPRQ